MTVLRTSAWMAAGWLAALGGAPGGAHSQTVSPAPHPAVACIGVTAGAAAQPLYPADALKRGLRGRVKIELSFTDPTQGPALQLLASEGDEAFADAVREHARSLRAPCLQQADGAAVVLREYVFVPDRRVVTWAGESAAAQQRSRALLSCVQPLDPGAPPPDYPPFALRDGLQGRVMAELMFNSRDQPPLARLHHLQAARVLADPVEAWVKNLRMPCHDGRPVHGNWSFEFRIAGEPTFGFKEMGFRTFVAAIKGIRTQRVDFDTREMGCPFDVRVHYLQPLRPNQVGELGPSLAERGPLLHWLAAAELDLKSRQQLAAFGDAFTLTVPCVSIDIKPQEKNP